MPLHLYQKEFLAGAIQLGGNEMGNSMYTVVVKEKQAGNSDNPGDGNTPEAQNAGGGISMYTLFVLLTLCLSASFFGKNASAVGNNIRT